MGRTSPHSGARLLWLPNALTIGRLAALPVLLVVLITAEGPTSGLAAAIFAVLGVSDLLDGYLARRLGAESRFGRIADPLADRLLVLVALVGLLLLDRIAAWGPAVLIVRELIVIGGFAALLRHGIEMRVDIAGKVSSALTMVARRRRDLARRGLGGRDLLGRRGARARDPGQLLEGGGRAPPGAGLSLDPALRVCAPAAMIPCPTG